MSIRVDALFDKSSGRKVRLSGPLWNAGVEASEVEDGEWVPTHFRFRTGDWFNFIEWRLDNLFTGLAHRPLLQLDSGDRDKWTIAVGMHLATQAAMNRYVDQTGDHALTTMKVLEMTGLLAAHPGRPTRMRQKLERALTRLVEEKLIKEWNWLDPGTRQHLEVRWCDDVRRASKRVTSSRTASTVASLPIEELLRQRRVKQP